MKNIRKVEIVDSNEGAFGSVLQQTQSNEEI